ncbi:CDF family Co(II)/Ni(II) efflux transporter DmeF [Arenimonas fontis]|uniref:CDF family Co(II)/Ni(II) efflux transporter DmeF n=1 Tax=Arenimonas fontis TaxID=2608255 RepID=A0A5B2Z8C6_9GAMM|nr:CDF family Co(II)/Ni(II) efflux transporter DmeF [Arenimonas fontis]KAA2284125.1 CDF family Co(II)/Ni(II) efflux transporter DmeF [Arenimonas fontis]
MHAENLSRWQHEHVFDTGSHAAERGTRLVMWITAVAMAVEIAAGWWFNSMALLADGWHMSSHALAIGLSAAAYAAARRYARDPRFAFGTWKIEVLGGFAGAIFLLGVAAMMVIGSLERLLSPEPIRYREAIAVAGLGLGVNLACALILGRAHHHGHGHPHGHGHRHDDGHHHGRAHGRESGHDHAEPRHHDLNLRSAYLHVIADAATSVLAIVALAGGWLYGWAWLDPVMGIVGAVLVAVWAKGLIRDTGKVLLDREMDHPVVEGIRAALESGPGAGDTRVTDLHVWRVGRHAYACAVVLVTHDRSLGADAARRRLAAHPEIVHSTIEIHHCPDSAG